MMEIKFKYYEYDELLPDRIRTSIYTLEQIERGELLWIYDISQVVKIKDRCRYTGLKDKNGVEIYEGDIVRFKNEEFISKVYFFKDCWVVDIYDELESLFVNQRDGDIEVIGNIYENSELMDKTFNYDGG